MADTKSLAKRLEDYQPTKTVTFWFGAACAVATLVIGFNWGGWVTGGTHQQMVSEAASEARAELAAAICVHRFVNGPNATAQLATLKAADSWKRDGIIEEKGLVTIAGMKEPVSGAADLCAEKLLNAKLPAVKAATKTTAG